MAIGVTTGNTRLREELVERLVLLGTQVAGPKQVDAFPLQLRTYRVVPARVLVGDELSRTDRNVLQLCDGLEPIGGNILRGDAAKRLFA